MPIASTADTSIFNAEPSCPKPPSKQRVVMEYRHARSGSWTSAKRGTSATVSPCSRATTAAGAALLLIALILTVWGVSALDNGPSRAPHLDLPPGCEDADVQLPENPQSGGMVGILCPSR